MGRYEKRYFNDTRVVGIAGNVLHIRRQGLELLNFQLRTDDK
jgi:hypothetical protein